MLGPNIRVGTTLPECSRITIKDIAIEFIAHRDNRIFIGLLLCMCVWLLMSGPHYLDLAWILLGWAIFMPQEYFTHVHVLHCPLPKTEVLYVWLYRLHYGHHDFPKRHDLMYMPLWLTLPMMLGNMLLMWLITPESHAFASAYCGALAGYIFFEWNHLLCHVPYVPKSRLWRNARNQHLLHHFFDEKCWYSVTPGLDIVDRIMGTKPNRCEAKRSDSYRHLGIDPKHAWLARARVRFAARSSGNTNASRLWMQAESKRD